MLKLSQCASQAASIFEKLESELCLGGKIRKREFRRALVLLDIAYGSPHEAGRLFDAFGPDASGSLRYRELVETLRSGAGQVLGKILSDGDRVQPGSVAVKQPRGDDTRTEPKVAQGRTSSEMLRDRGVLSSVLESSQVQEQLRSALVANAVRAPMDLFAQP